MHSPESGLERQVKEILHKAFWEILREELDSDPPQFKQVSPAQGILGDNQGEELDSDPPQFKQIIPA